MNDPTAIGVLYVSQDDVSSRIVQLLLEKAREATFQITFASSVNQAIPLLLGGEFRLILLDLDVQDVGREPVSRIKAASQSVPIVAFTGREDVDKVAIDAIGQGAQECLAKDCIMGDLLARIVRHAIARERRMQSALEQALTDPLTGLGNRRAFDADLQRRLADWNRHQTTFSVAIFDIDHFKSVNDTHGHDAGDRILCNIAAVLNRATRDTDQVVRYGGEEFAILFPVTRLNEAMQIVHRIGRTIAASDCDYGDRELSVTTSAGVAEVVEDDDERSVVMRADNALYAAKHAGRDCCFLHNGTSVMASVDSMLRPLNLSS